MGHGGHHPDRNGRHQVLPYQPCIRHQHLHTETSIEVRSLKRAGKYSALFLFILSSVTVVSESSSNSLATIGTNAPGALQRSDSKMFSHGSTRRNPAFFHPSMPPFRTTTFENPKAEYSAARPAALASFGQAQ